LRIKACTDVRTAAAIALELSQSSICCVEDLWSPEKITFVCSPEPQDTDPRILGEIILRSFAAYLERPGHVQLPNGMIPDEELERERNNALLRVRMFWEYWHGSKTLDHRRSRQVFMAPSSFPRASDQLTCTCSRSTSTLE
jgi:hypothetical protein